MKKPTKAMRATRALTALLLVFILSFASVFADSETQQNDPSADSAQSSAATGSADVQTAETDGVQPSEAGDTDASAGEEEVMTDELSGAEDASDDPSAEEGTADEPSAGEQIPEPEPAACIIKKGAYYYYQDADGAIRTKAGFVTAGENIYYVRRGGKIRTNATFKVKKKYYRANKYGVIKTGVYKWNKHYYYSYSSGQWKRKAGFVIWNGDKYYVQKGGRIITKDGFTVKNTAYVADSKGRVSKVVLPKEDTNEVVRIARKQVGIMTGKTYWVWYYRTRFMDTDRTPWCGAFVAWVYNKAGLYNKISIAKRFGSLGYVPSYSRYADRYKKWVKKKNARPGDIIVFGRNRHVGLVEGVYGKYIITIEGNAGPTAVIGCGKPGAVVRKIYKLSDKDIKGIIRVLK